MTPLQRVLALVCASVTLVAVYADGKAKVDPNCLGCICEAASRCDASTKCHVPYAGAYFCGPFHLSWAYWADAGKPVLQHDSPDQKGAFENCAQDLYCAAKVVRDYMGKFAEDCDGDGVVTCKDIVRIHKKGRTACKGPLPDDRFTYQFEECARRLNVF